MRHIFKKSVALVASAAEKSDYFRYILGLIAYALHVRYHLERGGYLPQIACHGLLLEQELQTQCLNSPLLLVYLAVKRGDLRGGFRVAVFQSVHGEGYHFFAKRAHLYHFFVEQRKLFVESASHYPNLPVM